MKSKRNILVIVGPTSSGKSALAVELARKFDGEVVSADSRQVYRGLNIGTGKITKREMRGIRHHLLDVASPKKVFTAHDFVQKARRAIEEIVQREKLPIIAGGTGFYIDALTGRIALPDVPVDPKLRTRLEKKTTQELFALLKKKDPRRAQTIESHNKRRLIRALEIVSALGRVPHSDVISHYNSPDDDILWMGLTLQNKVIEERIREKLMARMRQGMLREAKRLHKAGLSYRRMEQLGLEYRSLARYLQHKITYKEMLAELTRDIRRYAKKQLAYWKRNRSIHWFDPSQKNKVYSLARNWLRVRAH